jgi:hypothetical protein
MKLDRFVRTPHQRTEMQAFYAEFVSVSPEASDESNVTDLLHSSVHCRTATFRHRTGTAVWKLSEHSLGEMLEECDLPPSFYFDPKRDHLGLDNE